MSSGGKLLRREALKLGTVATAGSIAAPLIAKQSTRTTGQNRPNFVIFMTDGQRPDQYITV